MATYIFDLVSPTDKGQIYFIEVKISTQTLENDSPVIEKDSDDIDCEKRDYHKDSPFTLNKDDQSKKIVTPDKEICYRVNNSRWKRVI